MFGFLRFLSHNTGEASGPRTVCPEADPPSGSMRVVAVLPDMRDRLAFARVAGQLGWTFTTVVSSAAVAGALRPGIPHLVICDRDLSGETWQEALPRLAAMPHVVRVLLASTVVDEYLWDEVIKHRGFDVVVKPYDAERLRRVAAFARSSMRWQ